MRDRSVRENKRDGITRLVVGRRIVVCLVIQQWWLLELSKSSWM